MKTYRYLIVLAFFLLTTTSATALTISDVSVDGLGAPDELINAALLSNSGESTELNFISNSLSGLDVSDWSLSKFEFDDKVPSSYDSWTQLSDASNLWAFDFGLTYGPVYFLIKTGNKVTYNGSDVDTVLYRNLGSLSYGVVDFSVFGDKMELYKISHVSAPVPEPSTVLLLGSGLVGLAWYGRKRKKA